MIPDPSEPRRRRLTQTFVDAVQPRAEGLTYWDHEIPGLGVKVSSKGRKTYIFKYRVAGGRGGQQRKPTIGVHGAITCHQAREIARKWHAAVRLGGDPSGERRNMRDTPTISDLCERYLSDHARLKKKPKSVLGDESAILRQIKPALGSMKVNAVHRTDIERLHKSMRRTPTYANRIIALLSKMMTLAERWSLRPSHTNPCRGIERYAEKARERFLTVEELARLESALQVAEPTVAALIRLLWLTGARRGELQTLRWDWVELENQRLRLPDSKTGAKVIVLGDEAAALLRSIPRVDGNPFVFVGVKPQRHIVSVGQVWGRVRIRAGLPDVRMHDLRHTFASLAVANGASLPMIGRLLGHRNTSTTARYAHLLDEPLRHIANGVARSAGAA